MTVRTIAAVILLLVASGCTNMKPIDFKGTEPRLELDKYFLGETRAWGLFEDRFGTVRRQFVVDINGTLDGDELVLDERFLYSDGEEDRRVWRIRKTGAHTYEGRATDVIGIATGETYGNALRWRYELDLKVGDSKLRVRFDDWMFLQPSNVLLNRAKVRKFGIEIGEVTVVFMKPSSLAEANDKALSVQPPFGAAIAAAPR
jgi:hypothetical protein